MTTPAYPLDPDAVVMCPKCPAKCWLTPSGVWECKLCDFETPATSAPSSGGAS